MSNPTPTALQTAAPQTDGTAQAVTPEVLETFQVEADYEAHLEDRMGRYGY